MLESYLVSVALKSTILLAAGFLSLRSRSAAVRHLVCLVALAAAAAVPLVAIWSPSWSFVISVAAAPPAGQTGVASGHWNWAGNWPAMLSILWALGAAAMLIRAAGGWVLLMRARRGSLDFQSGEVAEIRVGNVTTPLACGVFRPVILLPANARDWDSSRLRAVLLHESAHVLRRDCLAKYIAQASRALLWWNPLAWILSARMNREQELACDDAVLAAGVPADAYANVLLDTARECSGSLLLGCAMTAGGVLQHRLAHLFNWRAQAVSPAWKRAVAIPALLALMTGVSCAEKIYKVGPGIVPPKLLKKTEPNYTDDARAKKLEGPVSLSMVVGVDQMAHNIKVTKSLDPGLDANAVAAIKMWKFQPGTKNGKPVPVRANVTVNFRLL